MNGNVREQNYRIRHVRKLLYCMFLLCFQETAACKFGWLNVNGKCYYFSRDSTNFFTAMSFCNLYGGKLVEIDNWYKYYTIKQLVNERRFPSFWIGLTDLFSEGAWVTATSMTSPTFAAWKPGEPNNWNNNEHCAAWVNVNNDQWNDEPCNGAYNHFVCEQ